MIHVIRKGIRVEKNRIFEAMFISDIIKQDDYHTLFEQTRFIKRKNKHEECLHLNADE